MIFCFICTPVIESYSRNAKRSSNTQYGQLSQDGSRRFARDASFETWQQYSDWHSFIETGNFNHLRDDLHRCKGGASLFGLERIVALIGAYESPSVLEEKGFDLTVFEQELKAAESAVRAMVG